MPRDVKSASNPAKRQRILLVDDHPLVRRALKQTIEREDDLVIFGEAEDHEEALGLLEQETPEMAIVDLSLKSSDGLDLIRDIRRKHPDILTLVLSMHNESVHMERAIRAGAHGYVSKREAPAEVMTAVRKILKGELYWPEKAVVETVNRLAGGGFDRNDAITARLSERERQVFELIGIGSTPAQIAAIMDVEVSTVDTYRSRIKEKLSLKGANELRHEAIRWNVARNAR